MRTCTPRASGCWPRARRTRAPSRRARGTGAPLRRSEGAGSSSARNSFRPHAQSRSPGCPRGRFRPPRPPTAADPTASPRRSDPTRSQLHAVPLQQSCPSARCCWFAHCEQRTQRAARRPRRPQHAGGPIPQRWQGELDSRPATAHRCSATRRAPSPRRRNATSYHHLWGGSAALQSGPHAGSGSRPG